MPCKFSWTGHLCLLIAHTYIAIHVACRDDFDIIQAPVWKYLLGPLFYTWSKSYRMYTETSNQSSWWTERQCIFSVEHGCRQ